MGNPAYRIFYRKPSALLPVNSCSLAPLVDTSRNCLSYKLSSNFIIYIDNLHSSLNYKDFFVFLQQGNAAFLTDLKKREGDR